MPDTGFPEGLHTRPPTPIDVEGVASLFMTAEKHDAEESLTTVEDVESGWNNPDFDLSQDALLVFEGEELIAAAELHDWKAEATVHPRCRGRGIGSSLLAWTEETTLRQRKPGEEARVGQTITDQNRHAVELFVRNGYEIRHTSWALRLPRDAKIGTRELPRGYAIRPLSGQSEYVEIYQIIEDAFNEWPNRKPSSFEAWKAWTVDRSDFDPTLVFVATAGDGIVGVAVGLPYPDEGWVHQLAVRADHRRRGLAKALLGAAFEEMRDRGYPDVGLSTDSRTGALDLYLDIGMVVRQSFTHYSKLLRPAGA